MPPIGFRYVEHLRPTPEHKILIEVCEELGIAKSTLLCAERKGKLPRAGRYKGARVYSPQDVERARAYFEQLVFERYVNYQNPQNRWKREWWHRNKHRYRRQPRETAPDDNA
jgi:hypothetical protein